MITTEVALNNVWLKIPVANGERVTIQDSIGSGFIMYAFTEVDSAPTIDQGHLLGNKEGIEFVGDGSFLWMKVRRGASKVAVTK